MKKAASDRKGADLEISETQIETTAQRGGSIFSTPLWLARPLIKPAVKALASAGFTFGAEKALKKILTHRVYSFKVYTRTENGC